MENGHSRLSPDDRRRMQEIAEALPTVSAKIRALAAAGYPRARIAEFLKKRYQHVRNVLIQSNLGGPEPRLPSRPSGFAEPMAAPAEPLTEDETGASPRFGTVVLDETGRVQLPPNVILALDGEVGRPIPWRFEDGELILMNRDAGIRHAQQLVASLPNAHLISSDSLIAERRAEAAREEERYERWSRGE